MKPILRLGLIFIIFLFSLCLPAQQVLNPEGLIQLGRLNGSTMSKDGLSIIFSVKKYNIETNSNSRKYFTCSVKDGTIQEIADPDKLIPDTRISKNGKFSIAAHEIKIKNIYGSDVYPALKKSDVMIYDNLNYRHWDTWEDGAFSHVFLNKLEGNKIIDSIDIMAGELFDCPQKPFGGDEDFLFSPDSKNILYVTKKKFGKDYAVSTNTDIYSYSIETGKTVNLTEGMMGYDTEPAYSSDGQLAFLSMKTDGYESDKNDLVVLKGNEKINLTKNWDGTITQFKWSPDNKDIYFTAPINGTVQLFNILINSSTEKPIIKQITNGDFDIKNIIGISGNKVFVERTDMNHAAELFEVNLTNGSMKQLSHINDDYYNTIQIGKVERRYFKATDGERLMTWVIFPPNFDSTKKYPTLLYCQGGPQSALSQFYSLRWNFQLMAANGYIVVAPNRRGMPGHGVKWNEQISGDYGGQNMKDYLTAIDEMAKEAYVDKNRLGCVGASYGGYSVFYLAGNHNKRFKSFIAHDGIFDWKSMYGTTEELFFVNYDLKGAYWEKSNAAAQKSFNEFNPINYTEKWDTPILIIQGGKDYRVPIEQGLQAFQVAQLRGIKSKLLYFPNENHWVLSDQNSLVWQKEFFKWLKETLAN
jgi:dipeptidyl aminopeptidase/acylaminoacyl peptidase